MLLTAQTGFVAALLLAVIAVNHSARGQGRRKDDRLVMVATIFGLMQMFSAAAAIAPTGRLWHGLFWVSAGLLPVAATGLARALIDAASPPGLATLGWFSWLFALASIVLAFTPWIEANGLLPWVLGGVLFALLVLTADRLRTESHTVEDPSEQGRLRLLWIGCSLALAMSGLEAVLGNLLFGLGTITPVILIAYLSASLMRERLLDSQELIARGAIFGVITFSVTALYSLLVNSFREQGATFVFATFISSAVLALLFDPLRAKVEATMMRWMMAGTAHLTEACFSARDGIRRSVQMEEMMEAVVRELHGTSIVTGIAVYLLDPGEQFLGLAAFGGSRPVHRLWLRDAPELFARLRDDPKPMSRMMIERERRRRAEWIGRVTAAEDAQVRHHAALLKAISDLGGDLLLPIRSESRVIGVLSLEDERRPEGYTPVERAALLALAGRLGIGLSNTDHMEQLRLRDRLATLGEMSAGLAHEIRNPLGSIKGAAQILGADEELPDNQLELLGIITAEVNHLDRVVQGFLDYARPSNLRRTLVDPGDFLRAVGRHLGNRLDLEIGEELAPIAIDSDRILQVLRNLVRNAQEAAPEEQVTLSGADRGGDLIIEVLDRGPGIDEALREQVFIPFVTSKDRGTGLGLAISQRIVKDHRGALDMRPREGGGTVARIALPRLAVVEADSGEALAAAQEGDA